MSCTICEYLERAYEATLSEYIQARRSACYQLCTELAAQKNVDMERARYELQEHQSACCPHACPNGLCLPVENNWWHSEVSQQLLELGG